MSMIESKGPRPYHVTTPRATEQVFAAARLAGEWKEPKYPGDSIAQVDLVRGDEIGDVRVQWYTDQRLKVGSFTPGYDECTPGDTPKYWPDKDAWVSDKASASRFVVQFLIAAFRDGWSIKPCT